MARINGTSGQRIFSITKWLGINENPDGETKLRMGEACDMRNWRITKDNHLQIRQGYSQVVNLGTTAVLGVWSGYINGAKKLIASCGGKLYSVDISSKTAKEIGSVTGNHAHFFGFGKKLYLLTGSKYYVYDGTALNEVAGYRPLVSVSNVPGGGGAALEQVNKLNGTRRAWFSPDGSATTFQLPEKDLASIDYVQYTANKAAITFTPNLTTGVVTTSSAVAKGTNSIEIGWTVSTNFRSQVEGMRFSETYNGETDTRVFIYGDGTNEAFYSGLDHDGNPTAEYFPDLNEIAVDSANTPITAMTKHFDRLLTFKTDGAFITQYGPITLADGATTAAFFTSPLNREIGNVAPGQAVVVKNDPLTLFGRSVYDWRLSSYASKDERNAMPISGRVWKTLAELDLANAICFDDEYNTEYYVCQNKTCVVYNYTADAWYIYTNIPATCFVSIDGELYFGTSDGKLMRLSRDYRNDNGKDIDAYWESGTMDFGADFYTKYAADLWISIEPESQARLNVTVQSNRKSDYDDKIVSSALMTFSHMSFEHFSFATNRHPQVKPIKLKVKKFTYYSLILTSLSSSATATVLGTDIKVRYADNVR